MMYRDEADEEFDKTFNYAAYLEASMYKRIAAKYRSHQKPEAVSKQIAKDVLFVSFVEDGLTSWAKDKILGILSKRYGLSNESVVALAESAMVNR